MTSLSYASAEAFSKFKTPTDGVPNHLLCWEMLAAVLMSFNAAGHRLFGSMGSRLGCRREETRPNSLQMCLGLELQRLEAYLAWTALSQLLQLLGQC